MNINEAFPSNYLKSSDLRGGSPTVIMSHVKFEKMGDDDKAVLYFEGKEKGLVLNKTNANNITDLYGPETNDWKGKAIVLTTAWVDFQGRSVEAIRVRPPSAKPAPAEEQVRESMPSHVHDDMSDEIPF